MGDGGEGGRGWGEGERKGEGEGEGEGGRRNEKGKGGMRKEVRKGKEDKGAQKKKKTYQRTILLPQGRGFTSLALQGIALQPSDDKRWGHYVSRVSSKLYR
jgi:hypothetical protein